MTQFLRVIAEMVLTLPWIYSNILQLHTLCCITILLSFARPPSQHITTLQKTTCAFMRIESRTTSIAFVPISVSAPSGISALVLRSSYEKRVQKVLGLEFVGFHIIMHPHSLNTKFQNIGHSLHNKEVQDPSKGTNMHYIIVTNVHLQGARFRRASQLSAWSLKSLW